MTRIGITQRVEVPSDRGERRDALDQVWISLLEELGFVPVFLSNRHQDVAAYATAMKLEGILLSGGNDIADGSNSPNVAPERDRTERALLDWAKKHLVPVLGVCRGFQMMNVHLGGRLVPVNGHVAINHSIHPLRNAIRLPASVNSFHNWAIPDGGLAAELEPLSAADDGTIESARHRHLPWQGVMWHPERDIPEPRFHHALVGEALRGEANPR